jgi:predicted ATPase/DNA-binding XRE family transcriptional regulator
MANRIPAPFGVLLKRYRMAAQLTQEQLAARASLSPDAIRALESGKRRTPRPDSARLLADALVLTGAEREALLAAAVPQRAATPVDHELAPAPAARLGGLPPTLLLGREAELAIIHHRLVGDISTADQRGEHVRLLTLTGPAGVGKTRLALAAATQIANHFPDGVVLVDLTPIRDPPLVLPTIARAFGFVGMGNRPLPERLQEYLRERSTLLVLDNFEQVLPAASVLADLLSACPALALLVTSRVPLHLRWEWTLRIAPLPVPDLTAPLPLLDVLAEIPAVALFVERARARQADFVLTTAKAPLVARVVSELDGLPLALELAAARLDALSLPTVARRLGHRLQLLRWDAPDMPKRQQSLEAAIGWSYDLLSEPEQQVFRCLGVFAGRVALDAIAAVVSGVTESEAGDSRAADAASVRNQDRALDWLASLAEKSLVLPVRQQDRGSLVHGAAEDEDAEPIFSTLETVREYAWERLAAAGELAVARRAHAHYFLALAERADPHLRGRDQLAWYRRLEHEQANLRAALRWLLDQDGPDAPAQREDALRLASALAWFWWTRGYMVEGWRWLEEALRRAPEAVPALRVRALLGAGAVLAYQGQLDGAKALLEEARALAQEQQQPAEVARALTYSGLRALYAGDVTASVPSLEEALRRVRAIDDPHLLGLTLLFLGTAALAQGHDEQAASLYAESLTRFEVAGDALWAANLHVNLGWFALQQGDLPAAVGRIRIGLEASVTFEDRRLLGVGAQMVLSLLRRPGESTDLAQQVRLLGAIDALSQATGMTLLQAVVRASMAELREQLKRAGLEATYREGNGLPFQAIATLALTLLDEVDRALTRSTSEPDEAPARSSNPQAVSRPDIWEARDSRRTRGGLRSERSRRVHPRSPGHHSL